MMEIYWTRLMGGITVTPTNGTVFAVLSQTVSVLSQTDCRAVINRLLTNKTRIKNGSYNYR